MRSVRQRWLASGACLVLLAVGWGWLFRPASSVSNPPEPNPPSTSSRDRSSQREMTAAKVAIDRGDLTTARRHLDSLLAKQPDHAQALLFRGQVLRESGDLDGALADWSRVSSASPTDAGVAAYLESTVLLERGDAVAAEASLLRSMELHPTYVQPQQRLLELYVVQLRRADVLALLEHIRRLRVWNVQELVFSIVPLARATTPDSGVALTRQYVETRPDDLASRLALGQYLFLAQRFTDAEQTLRELTAMRPDDQEAAGWLALACLKQGEHEKAHAVLEAFPLTDVSPTSLVRSWAQLELVSQRWTEAIGYLERVVREEPEDLASRYQLGQALLRAGRKDEAHACLEDAELIDHLQTESLRLVWGSKQKIEQMVDIALGVAETLMKLDRPAEAVAWYQQVLGIRPQTAEAIAGMQHATARLQAQQSAVSDTRPIARVEPPSAAVDAPAVIGDTLAFPRPSAASTIRFDDVHEQAGLDFQYFNGQTEYRYLVESTGGGVAVLDFDQDGWPDLYFPQGCNLPVDLTDRQYRDRLWRNDGGHTFTDVTDSAQIVETGYGQGVAAGDFDNDGFPDLIVANYGRNTFYRNNGDGTFADLSNSVGLAGEVMSSSVAMADLNRDGLLDVYIANYVESMKVCRNADGSYSTCNPSNFEGEQDHLYMNAGDGTVRDVTVESGVTAIGGKGLGVVVSDLDRDGWADIYVANDTTPNFLFKNLGADGTLTFREIGLQAGLALSGEGRAQAGMGIACGDLDGNGLQDLYVTNFFQETNTLYLNEGDDLFTDATQPARLAAPTHGLLAFGTQVGDFNRDARPDLFVTNGHIDDFRNLGEPWKMPPQLFENEGQARFRNVSKSAGDFFAGEYLGRGVARLDWNRDGLPDVVVVHQDRPAALLENVTTDAGHGLVIELHGTQSNRDAIGAVITVATGEQTQVVEITGGDGFFASNERRQFVGVGEKTMIDRLEILWPSGRHDVLTDLPVDHSITFVESRSEPLLSELPWDQSRLE